MWSNGVVSRTTNDVDELRTTPTPLGRESNGQRTLCEGSEVNAYQAEMPTPVLMVRYIDVEEENKIKHTIYTVKK